MQLRNRSRFVGEIRGVPVVDVVQEGLNRGRDLRRPCVPFADIPGESRRRGQDFWVRLPAAAFIA